MEGAADYCSYRDQAAQILVGHSDQSCAQALAQYRSTANRMGDVKQSDLSGPGKVWCSFDMGSGTIETRFLWQRKNGQWYMCLMRDPGAAFGREDDCYKIAKAVDGRL